MSWFRGALGELRVGRMLRELGPGWRVLHAVPHGEQDADIDHLVIGPGGVFTINTKNHPGRRIWAAGKALLVDGRRTAYLTAAEHEARSASRALTRATRGSVVATPIVAVVDPAQIGFGRDWPTTTVVAAAHLVRHLRLRPSMLAPEQVAVIARAAEEWTTWRPLAADVHAPADPGPAFARLRSEVASARARRVLWGGAFVAGLAAAVVGSAASLLG